MQHNRDGVRSTPTTGQLAKRDNSCLRVLEIKIHHKIYPVTEDVLHQVFDSYGVIDDITLCGKSMLVFFRDSGNAFLAKHQLHGRNIYDGCYQLDIQFHKLESEESINLDNDNFDPGKKNSFHSLKTDEESDLDEDGQNLGDENVNSDCESSLEDNGFVDNCAFKGCPRILNENNSDNEFSQELDEFASDTVDDMELHSSVIDEQNLDSKISGYDCAKALETVGLEDGIDFTKFKSMGKIKEHELGGFDVKSVVALNPVQQSKKHFELFYNYASGTEFNRSAALKWQWSREALKNDWSVINKIRIGYSSFGFGHGMLHFGGMLGMIEVTGTLISLWWKGQVNSMEEVIWKLNCHCCFFVSFDPGGVSLFKVLECKFLIDTAVMGFAESGYSIVCLMLEVFAEFMVLNLAEACDHISVSRSRFIKAEKINSVALMEEYYGDRSMKTVEHNWLAAAMEDLTSKGVVVGYNREVVQFHGLDRGLIEAKEIDTMQQTLTSTEDQFNPPAVSLVVSAHADIDLWILVIAWNVHKPSWQGLSSASKQSVEENLGCAQPCIQVAPYLPILRENNSKKLEMTTGITGFSLAEFILVVAIRSWLLDDNDLRDVMWQNLKSLRIDVQLNNDNMGKATNRSGGNSIPLRSPRVQHPMPCINNGIAEVLKSMPEPLREALSKLSLDLASKAVLLSNTVLTELVDRFSKKGQSNPNAAHQSQDGAGSSTQTGASDISAAPLINVVLIICCDVYINP